MERTRVRMFFDAAVPEMGAATRAALAAGGDPDVILCEWLAGRDFSTLTPADLGEALAAVRAFVPVAEPGVVVLAEQRRRGS